MTALPAPIQRMIDATNAADTEAFIDTFSDDAYLEDWGRTFHGKSGVRSWNDTDNIGKNAHFHPLDMRYEGADTVVALRVTGGGYNGTSDIRFTVVDDQITRLVIKP